MKKRNSSFNLCRVYRCLENNEKTNEEICQVYAALSNSEFKSILFGALLKFEDGEKACHQLCNFLKIYNLSTNDVFTLDLFSDNGVYCYLLDGVVNVKSSKESNDKELDKNEKKVEEDNEEETDDSTVSENFINANTVLNKCIKSDVLISANTRCMFIYIEKYRIKEAIDLLKLRNYEIYGDVISKAMNLNNDRLNKIFIEKTSAKVKTRKFKKGEILLEQNKIPDSMYLVTEGSLLIACSYQEQTVISLSENSRGVNPTSKFTKKDPIIGICICSKGQLVGESYFLNRNTLLKYSVRCHTDSAKVLEIKRIKRGLIDNIYNQLLNSYETKESFRLSRIKTTIKSKSAIDQIHTPKLKQEISSDVNVLGIVNKNSNISLLNRNISSIKNLKKIRIYEREIQYRLEGSRKHVQESNRDSEISRDRWKKNGLIINTETFRKGIKNVKVWRANLVSPNSTIASPEFKIRQITTCRNLFKR